MNPIPFNLEAAKAGAKVITRDGRNVRIGFWNAKGLFPLAGLAEVISGQDKTEIPIVWTEEGKYYANEARNSELDLFMAPEEISSDAKEQSQMTTITDAMINSLNICDPAKNTLKSWFVGEELSEKRIREKLFSHMHVNSEGKTAINIGATCFTTDNGFALVARLLTVIDFLSLSLLVEHFEQIAKPKRNYSLDGANGTKKVELVEFGGVIVLRIGNYNILRLKDFDQVLERIEYVHPSVIKIDSQQKAVIL